MVGIGFLPCNRTVASSNLTYPSHCIVTLDKLITLILRKATGNPQITTSSDGVKARWTRIRAENSLSNVGLSSKYEGAVHSMSPSSLGTFPHTFTAFVFAEAWKIALAVIIPVVVLTAIGIAIFFIIRHRK